MSGDSKSRWHEYPLLPGAELDGFAFGCITPLEAGRPVGAGFVQGPNGKRAGLQWELSDSPYLMRISPPNGEAWGVYRLGFTQPVAHVDDLLANLRPLLPKLQILYARAHRIV
jgi:hypothetical protein